jgi:hypothetical protein
MILAPFGPMSARPGSKNTSWSAVASESSWTLRGADAEDVAEVDDELDALGFGAGSAGEFNR